MTSKSRPVASPRKSAEIRRQDIIAAAMEVIRHEGVSKLTTRSLSKAAGIAQPTLFLHFGNKSQVLIALVDAIQNNLLEKIRELPLEKLSPLERLKTVIRFHLNFIQQQPGIPRLLFSEELQSGDATVRERMQSLVETFIQFLSSLISAAQKSGEIRCDLDPARQACLLIAAVQGSAFRWILSGQQFTLAEQAEIIIITFIEGWSPRPPGDQLVR